ncbi:MAG: hypothetical protein WD380_10215 [Gaiellaceae bacterium]
MSVDPVSAFEREVAAAPIDGDLVRHLLVARDCLVAHAITHRTASSPRC